MMRTRATVTTRLMPKRFINAAANGPINPNNSSLTAMASEISSLRHPNSC